MAEKKTATAAIAEDNKYSAEALRSNMATGGGEPIPKGKKWTTEKRRLQPRDPDTGHFTYNADAQLGLKYKSHGKANAIPISARKWILNDGVKKGEVVNQNKDTWIVIEGVDKEKIIDFFRHYDEETMEYYSYGELPSMASIADGFDEVKGQVKAVKLSDYLVKKRGRKSAAEKKGIEKGAFHLGEVDLDNVSKTTKEEIKKKKESMKKGFHPGTSTQFSATMDAAKKKANEFFNQMADEKKKQFGETVKSGNSSGGSSGGTPAQNVAQNVSQASSSAPKKSGHDFMENGKIISSKVDYKNPATKGFFDGFAKQIKKDPKGFGMTQEMANAITGEKLAYMAKNGAFDGHDFSGVGDWSGDDDDE